MSRLDDCSHVTWRQYLHGLYHHSFLVAARSQLSRHSTSVNRSVRPKQKSHTLPSPLPLSTFFFPLSFLVLFPVLPVAKQPPSNLAMGSGIPGSVVSLPPVESGAEPQPTLFLL